MNHGRRVLVTRPQPAATATLAQVRRLGWQGLHAPMLVISTLPATLPPADAIQAVLVTSANALPGLPASYHAVPLLAVGEATASQARAAGFAHVRSADGDAGDLAALTRACCRPAGLPLLLVHGQGHGAVLLGRLARAGYAVQSAAVYRTAPALLLPQDVAAAWAARRLEAALFFSADTARTFVRLIQAAGVPALAGGVDAVAIAAGVAQALAALPWRSVRVADRPDQEAMLALLQ